MLELLASLTFYKAEEGGLPHPVHNGLRPSFSYSGELVACEVWVEDCSGLVPHGESLLARIRLPYAEQLGWVFEGGESFKLNIASQVIGEGVVLLET